MGFDSIDPRISYNRTWHILRGVLILAVVCVHISGCDDGQRQTPDADVNGDPTEIIDADHFDDPDPVVDASDEHDSDLSRPISDWQEIAAGWTISCGIRASGAVSCWGTPTFDPELDGAVHGMSGSSGVFCALDDQGQAVCWGDPILEEQTPDTHFIQVVAGVEFACGLTELGAVHCWCRGAGAMPCGTLWETGIAQIAAGYQYVCGLDAEGAASCFGLARHGQTNPPRLRYTQLSLGNLVACGLLEDGDVECWGDWQVSANGRWPGPYVSVTVGGGHACGRFADGLVQCWGYGQAAAPEARFLEIDAGGNHNCGITEEGTALCWGCERHNWGQCAPPEE